MLSKKKKKKRSLPVSKRLGSVIYIHAGLPPLQATEQQTARQAPHRRAAHKAPHRCSQLPGRARLASPALADDFVTTSKIPLAPRHPPLTGSFSAFKRGFPASPRSFPLLSSLPPSSAVVPLLPRSRQGHLICAGGDAGAGRAGRAPTLPGWLEILAQSRYGRVSCIPRRAQRGTVQLHHRPTCRSPCWASWGAVLPHLSHPAIRRMRGAAPSTQAANWHPNDWRQGWGERGCGEERSFA